MKLYLLKPKDSNDKTFCHDCSHGHVVRAQEEAQARILVYASKESGDEGKGVWLDYNVTTCEEIDPNGKPGIILTDFLAG